MSITALVTGKLIADPEQRTGASGKAFTTFRMVAGTEDESVLVSGIAFSSAAAQLAALGKGDTLAAVGRCKPKSWVGKDGAARTGLDIVADQVLTAYHVRRKRSAMAGNDDGVQRPHRAGAGRSAAPASRSRPPPDFPEDEAWLTESP